MPTDIHQHLLPAPLIDALLRRTTPPRLIPDGRLELAAEPPSRLQAIDHDPGARGGPAGAIHDPLVWFDTSSYGARTLDSMLRMVGVDRLVHGSDRPVVASSDVGVLGDAVEYALTTGNPDLVFGAAAVAR